MDLTKVAAMPGYFQLRACGDGFAVIGNSVHHRDTVQCEALVENLAEMLSLALTFSKLANADEILARHYLSEVE